MTIDASTVTREHPWRAIVRTGLDSDDVTDQVAYFTSRMRELMQRPTPDGKRWSDRALAKAAAELGHDLSPTYVRQLRTGQRANPSIDIVRALADVFGIPMSYFYNTDQGDEIDKALETLQAAGADAILARGGGRISAETLRRIADAVRPSDTRQRPTSPRE